MSAEKLADLMAFAVAQTVYAVEPAGYGVQATRKQNSHQIARAVGLDMADYWTADAAFFGALGKPELIKALQEGAEADPAALEKLKKAELAGRAATELEGKRWLPDILRTPPAVAEKVADAAKDESDADEHALAA